MKRSAVASVSMGRTFVWTIFAAGAVVQIITAVAFFAFDLERAQLYGLIALLAAGFACLIGWLMSRQLQQLRNQLLARTEQSQQSLQSQQALVQQERLRALGQMASGIAHDINNAISPVALYTESLLEREPGLSERARSYLTAIQRAMEDVARTLSRMREFYRERDLQHTRDRVDINRSILQVLELTRPRWSSQSKQGGVAIELRTELEAQMPQLVGADDQIRDALMNLVLNAVDAMPEGGTLTVESRAVKAGDGLTSVVVEVSDTGVGMDEDTRRRCLEPFYTTKGERGTGLGLPMVYGMVQRHGASLEISSAPGRGTTVRLVFAASVSEVRAPPAGLDPGTPRQLRILLVDDDPLVLDSLRETLQRDGHVVTASNGGQAAIDAFTAAQQRGEQLDLVITDLGMPSVDGLQVASGIKALSSTTPVVMLTGWGQRKVDTNSPPAGVDRVLGKPPRLADLRATLAELVP